MKALIAIDGSEASEAAVDTAASLSWSPTSRIEVLTVLPTESDLYGGPKALVEDVDPTGTLRRLRQGEGDRILHEAVERLEHDDLAIVARRPEGRAATTIVEEAALSRAGLIIVGAQGHGMLARVLVGSVSSEVVDRASCPVLVARGRSARRILIGADGSDQAMAAVAFVATSGLFRSAEIRVVHAMDLRPAWWLGFTAESVSIATAAYDAALAIARERATTALSAACATLEAAGFTPSTTIREGDPAAAILDAAAAWQADLIVVGTRGLSRLKEMLLGSTARSVLQRSPISVLVTRGVPSAGAVVERPTADAALVASP
jgi:nucleotide-binding universal stress UspA family protein